VWLSKTQDRQAEIDAILADSGVTPEAAAQMQRELDELEAGRRYTAHWDSFCADNLPAPEWTPEFKFSKIWLRHPDRLNAASELLDRMVASGHGESPCFRTARGNWLYQDVLTTANAMAETLLDDFGVVPGTRVLLRGYNTPYLFTLFLALLKLGAVAVPTPPSMRARDLVRILEMTQTSCVICDDRLVDELMILQEKKLISAEIIQFGGAQQLDFDKICQFGWEAPSVKVDWPWLEVHMASKTGQFDNFDTASEDICLIALTGGTSGNIKGAMHHHRDLIVAADGLLRTTLTASPDDVFSCNLPLSSVSGLLTLVLMPMRIGASSVILQQFDAKTLIQAIQRMAVTIALCTSTTLRLILDLHQQFNISSLKVVIANGEKLSEALAVRWAAKTGCRIIEAINTTGMLAMFIASSADEFIPGSTGQPIDGFQCRVVDESMRDIPPNMRGRLAVKGPTGYRFLGQENQKEYVQDGWNITGDFFTIDKEGFFSFRGRADDIIDNGGYEVFSPKVEAILAEHPDILDIGVVEAPDKALGVLVKAYVVPGPKAPSPEIFAPQLTKYAREHMDVYEAPVRWEFVTLLPRSDNGTLLRYKLREHAIRHYKQEMAKQEGE
jgi:2-aminobenzoate-CoA ligase